MKNNYLLIFLILFMFSLTLKKLGVVGGGTLLILSTALLIIGYVNKLIKPKPSSLGLKLLLIEISIYLIFTLIGILCRHQFWNLPFWYVLFKYVWPVFSLIIIIHLVISKTHFITLTDKVKNTLVKEFALPLVFVFILAVPTFFTTTENFVKIFKSYSYEELINLWNSKENL